MCTSGYKCNCIGLPICYYALCFVHNAPLDILSEKMGQRAIQIDDIMVEDNNGDSISLSKSVTTVTS